MRAILIAVAVLAACATGPAQVQAIDEMTLRVLTPAELSEAFAGSIACRGARSDTMCEGVIVPISITETSIRVQESGVTAIAGYAQGPVKEFIVQLPWYAKYEGLFQDLEAQRVRGGFAYVRMVETAEAHWDAERNAWCPSSEGEQHILSNVQFYFSHDSTTRAVGDEAFAPQAAQRLSEFVTELLASRELRERAGDDPEAALILGIAAGATRLCASYYGVVANGRPELRGIVFTTLDGQSLPSMNDVLRARPAGAVLQLNPE